MELFRAPGLNPEDGPRGDPEGLGCFFDTQAPLLHFLEDQRIFIKLQPAHVSEKVIVLALRKGTFQTLGGYLTTAIRRDAIELGAMIVVKALPETGKTQSEAAPELVDKVIDGRKMGVPKFGCSRS